MNSQLKSRSRVADHGEVFTAPREVNAMLDLLPPESFALDKTFLEPACGTGNFLVEILEHKFKWLSSRKTDNSTIDKQLLNAVASIYAIDIQQDNVIESRRRLLNLALDFIKSQKAKKPTDSFVDALKKILSKNIIWGNALTYADYDSDKELEFCARSGFDDSQQIEKVLLRDMVEGSAKSQLSFHAIIGNPPYQQSDGGAAASAMPIYHKFIEQAIALNPNFMTMIIPSRWFTSGKGLDNFRENMLADKRISHMVDHHDARQCFPQVEIKGGVCYFLWDKHHDDKCQFTSVNKSGNRNTARRYLLEEDRDVFIRYNQAIPILQKVEALGQVSFSKLVSSRKPFGLSTNASGLSAARSDENDIKIYANKKIGFLNSQQIQKNKDWIGKYKVLVPYAVGSGNPGSDVLKPILAKPGTACTETYLIYGPFDSKREARNVLSYVNTKFFHFMLTLRKNTQHATRKVYDYVPLQDFTERWDDTKLYQLYNLSETEIQFIERLIIDRIPLKNHG